jgi:hypothetical protein
LVPQRCNCLRDRLVCYRIDWTTRARVLIDFDRIRSPHTASHFRNGACRRLTGPFCPHTQVSQQDECHQSYVGSAMQPATTRRDCARARQEAGRRAQGVLWRECALDVAVQIQHLYDTQSLGRQILFVQIEHWEEHSTIVNSLVVYPKRLGITTTCSSTTSNSSFPLPFPRLTSWVSYASHHPLRPLSRMCSLCHFISLSNHTAPTISHPTCSTPLPAVPGRLIHNLLIQHNAVHTRLQQREHETRLPLQSSQRIEYLGRRVRRKVRQERRHLVTTISLGVIRRACRNI